MDIGPISAIRPVTMIKPISAAPDVSRVVEAEYLGHSGDDEYTPANRKAARGLEDEGQEPEQEILVDSDAPFRTVASTGVSFFA
jgi:hypothetical protein